MPTIEERVADLEGRMKPDLREEMNRGFERMHDEMTRGFERMHDEMTRGFERTESRVDRIEDRMHRQFTWIVGIQLTTMLTVIGVLAAAYFR